MIIDNHFHRIISNFGYRLRALVDTLKTKFRKGKVLKMVYLSKPSLSFLKRPIARMFPFMKRGSGGLHYRFLKWFFVFPNNNCTYMRLGTSCIFSIFCWPNSLPLSPLQFHGSLMLQTKILRHARAVLYTYLIVGHIFGSVTWDPALYQCPFIIV